MKVYEIIVTEESSSEKKHRRAYQSGKSQLAARADSYGYDSKKGLIRYDASGRAVPIKPIEAIKSMGASAAQRTSSAILTAQQKFYKIPFIKLIGVTSAIVVPITQWIEDIAAVNELHSAGAFASDPNQQQMTADLREYYSLIAMSRVISGLIAFAVIVKANPAMVRGIASALRFIPGAGLLLALPGALAIQAGLVYLLNQESVQKFLATKLLLWAAPAGAEMGDLGGLLVQPQMKNIRGDLYNAVKDYIKGSPEGQPSSSGQQATPTSSSSTETPRSGSWLSSLGSVSAKDLIKQLG